MSKSNSLKRAALALTVASALLISCALPDHRPPEPTPVMTSEKACAMIPTHTLNNIAGTPTKDEHVSKLGQRYFSCNLHFDRDSDPSALAIYYDPKDFTGEFRIKGVRTFEQIKASVPTTPASIDGVPGEGLTSFYNGWSFLVWRYPDGALLVIKFFTKDSGGVANALDLTGPALEVGKIVAPQVRDLVAHPTASPT